MPPAVLPLHLLVFLPVLVGALSYFLPRKAYQMVMLIGNLAVTAFALRLFIAVRWDGDIIQLVAGWPETVAIKLVADRISAPLVLMTAAFFSAAYIFCSRADYLDKTFIFIFLMLEGALFGVFLSGDLFNIYVIMELGMLAIAILIMYKRDRQAIYNATLYIMMNFIAMAFMMLGIAYLYRVTGVMDLAEMGRRIAALGDKRVLIVPFAMVMTAIALKSALLPLFSWLPKAHGAPSAPPVVSAVLSGVQVKVGVYLIIRLGELFSPAIDIGPLFMWLGFLTSVAGFLLAVSQKDIKLILAYHTVSQVGLIVMGLHLGSPVAFWGAMYHVINHALFKGLLFLSAGAVIEAYGTRDYSAIRGVLRSMPIIGAATVAGMLGITGAPFFNGSISKYFISRGLSGEWGELGLYLINFGTMLSFVKYASILFGRPAEAPRPSRDPFIAGVCMLFGAAILAGGLFGGRAVALAFGQDISAAGALAPSKLLSFGATLGLALLAYKFAVPRLGKVLAWVRSTRLSFNQITALMSLFFALLLGYAWRVM